MVLNTPTACLRVKTCRVGIRIGIRLGFLSGYGAEQYITPINVLINIEVQGCVYIYTMYVCIPQTADIIFQNTPFDKTVQIGVVKINRSITTKLLKP